MSETYTPAFAAKSEASKPIQEGDFIEGTVAEADPNAISEKPIERHEGVVTRDKGKTWEVTDVEPDWGNTDDGNPTYSTREVFKDGAEKREIPEYKKHIVENMQKQVKGDQ